MFRQAQHGAFIPQIAKLPNLPDVHIAIADNAGTVLGLSRSCAPWIQ